MNIHVQPDYLRMQMQVYVEVHDDEVNGKRWYLDRDGIAREVAYGGEAPMFLAVDNRIAEALGNALAPRPEAGARHLEDALTVRNRLLGVVERIIDADLAREAPR